MQINIFEQFALVVEFSMKPSCFINTIILKQVVTLCCFFPVDCCYSA